MLEKTEGEINNGQSRDTCNIEDTGQRQTKTQHTKLKRLVIVLFLPHFHFFFLNCSHSEYA
jgi:hypothetical protein